jgi:hypothetical protein
VAYSTRQAVLQEAGLWHRELDGAVSGLVNSSNKKYYTEHKPLTDNDYSDTFTTSDVVLYVDGVAVAVTGVVALTGEIEATAAPTTGATVTADYSYSPLADAFVDGAIEEADEWIDLSLESVTFDVASKTVRKISRTYAAGLIMSREYGLQVTDESVKEGERKIKQAERWLADYMKLLKLNADDTNTSSAGRANEDVRLFQTYDEQEGRWERQSDEQFDYKRST